MLRKTTHPLGVQKRIQLQLHLVRLYAAGFNLTVESECVFKTSSNWVLHLSSCI